MKDKKIFFSTQFRKFFSFRKRILFIRRVIRMPDKNNIGSAGFALPGVCSPVEAGEVARVAWRKGGDLPRGLHYVQDDYSVFAREHSDRGNTEDGSTNDYTAAPPSIAGKLTDEFP